MSRNLRVFCLVSLAILLSACSPAAAATPTINASDLITQAAQTVAVSLSQTAAANPTGTSTLTPVYSPTATASPQPTIDQANAPGQPGQPGANATSAPAAVYSTPSACDVAGFVSDVTIPDGTVIDGGASFTKTWELRNDGTCSWNSSYLLVYYSGTQMSGPASQQLTTGTVAPGGMIDVSVELAAPATTGTSTGYWILRNASGTNFGIGSAGSPFYVQIVVNRAATSTPTATATEGPTSTPTATAVAVATATAVSATATPTTAATATPVTPTASPVTPTATPETPTVAP